MSIKININKQQIPFSLILTMILESNEIANEIFSKLQDTDITLKNDKTPVTKADKLVSQHITNTLKKLTPTIPIIDEEAKEIPYEERKHYSYFWCLDPIDGTKEFIAKRPEFTINLGLVKDNKPIFGIVSCPPLNKIYYAIKNKGSFLIDNDEIQQIEISKNIDIPKIICSRSHMTPETKDYLNTLNIKYDLISKGSSLKFMAIAEGTAEIYPRFTGSMEWDTCASQIIVEEAGGKIKLIDSEATITYNKPNLLNPYFIVYNPNINDKIPKNKTQ